MVAQAPLLALLFFISCLAASDAAWCVCRSDQPPTALQKTLDYACGAGADCSQVLQTGGCYNPNTVLAHCSYAANSYYQRKGQVAGACDFTGTATVTATDPSYSGCTYPANPSSAGTPITNPPNTAAPGMPAPGTAAPGTAAPGTTTPAAPGTTAPGTTFAPPTTPGTIAPPSTFTPGGGISSGVPGVPTSNGVLGNLGPSANTDSSASSMTEFLRRFHLAATLAILLPAAIIH